MNQETKDFLDAICAKYTNVKAGIKLTYETVYPNLDQLINVKYSILPQTGDKLAGVKIEVANNVEFAVAIKFYFFHKDDLRLSSALVPIKENGGILETPAENAQLTGKLSNDFSKMMMIANVIGHAG